jgi:hypothetical protein
MLFYNVPYLSASQIKLLVIMYTDYNIIESQNFICSFLTTTNTTATTTTTTTTLLRDQPSVGLEMKPQT